MSYYLGKKVLVTGANGFIAGRLVERLILEEGAEVRVLMRNWTNAAWIARLNPTFYTGDVTRPESLDEAVAGCDIVFHCASGGDTRGRFAAINVGGTENIAKAALQHGTERLVYVSSVAVHGARLPQQLDEDTPTIRTGRSYADSKVEAESLIHRFIESDGLRAVIVRPTYVWGPRGGQFTVGPLMSMRNGSFRLVDGGDFESTAIYVDNLIELLLLCGVHSKAIGQVFLGSDGGTYTWAELFEGYARMLHQGELSTLSSKSPFTRLSSRAVQRLGELLEAFKGNPAPFWKKVVRRLARITQSQFMNLGIPDPWYLALYSNRTHASMEKARAILGYEPPYSLDEALADTERWVLDQLGWGLELTDELGRPHRPPVFERTS